MEIGKTLRKEKSTNVRFASLSKLALGVVSKSLYTLAPRVSRKIANDIFFTPRKYKINQKEIESISKAEDFFISHRGKRIKVYRWGESEKIVLLVHGWGSRGVQFHHFIKPLLDQGFSVVTYDNPGHGQSDGKGSNFIEFVDTLDEIYHRFNGIYAVISHSFGSGALFNLVKEQELKVPCVFISPVTEVVDTVYNFASSLGIDKGLIDGFVFDIERRFDRDFRKSNPANFIDDMTSSNLLVIHCENDRAIKFNNSFSLFNDHDYVKFSPTKGLGHFRILRDESVIKASVDFILQQT